MTNKFPLSVVIITKNEEMNIGECLQSVAWTDDIVVMDDGSADRTVEISKRFTPKVFQKKMEVEGIHRNWAQEQCKNEWVLSLDADETVSPELAEELKEVISKGTHFAGFSIPRRSYISGHFVRYGGWYPAGKLRLFRKDKFRWEEANVHPRVFLDGECGHLTKDIIHKGHPNLAHFLNSVNRQTTLEAEKWFRDGRKMGFWRAMRKAHDRFFKGYFLKQGFRDGFLGWVVAYFAALYQIMSYAKYWELKQKQIKPK